MFNANVLFAAWLRPSCGSFRHGIWRSHMDIPDGVTAELVPNRSGRPVQNFIGISRVELEMRGAFLAF